MFTKAHNGIITMTRGDNVSIPLFINAGTELIPLRYVLKDNDIVYFGLCEPNQPFENATVRKMYTKDNRKLAHNGDLLIVFDSKDTEYLEDGLYYYTIKLETIKEDGSQVIQTLVPKTKFFIED